MTATVAAPAATAAPRIVDHDVRSGELTVRGRFALAESIGFGFGGHRAERGEQVLRLAFVVDGYERAAGVVVSQPAPDTVRVTTDAPGVDPAVVLAQVARVLSLDVDARGWDALGREDALLGRLQRARPGLRPPLFHSAYEAAAWSVLSARRPAAAMAAVRDRLSAAHGTGFELAGSVRHAFPTPAALLQVTEFDGIPERKLTQLRAIAALALEGGLDTPTLRDLPVDDATDRLLTINGIGPFYAMLVVVRALGHTDVLARDEPRLLRTLGALLGRPGPAEPAELERLAARWHPWRTWATVALRAAGPVVLGRS